MIYNEIIQGNDFSKNLISFESEKYILFDCEIYSEFLPVGWIKKLVKWQMKGCAYFWFLVT